MKKRLLFILAGLVLVVFAACSSDTQETETNDQTEENVEEELIALDAKLEIPETADTGETVTFTTTVLYGNDLVTDADQVQYEIWENGKKDDSEMIDAENNEDGTYTLVHTFEHDADYTVQVHVDAVGQHTMPKKEIVVGGGSDSEEKNHSDD